MKLAPIVIFTYNRLDCLKETVKHLQGSSIAAESEVYIFSDGPRKDEDVKKVEEVRKFLTTITGFKKINIKEARQNRGLANSVIAGVSEMLKKYDKVIVIEDDIVSSPDFLEFMNKSLEFYAMDDSIWSVTGYCPPIKIPKNYPHDVFLALRPSSWGWGTWKNRWQKIDWEIKDYKQLQSDRKKQRAFNKGGNDLLGMLKSQMEGKIDSWAIRWSYNQFYYKSYSVYPVETRIKHIGVGEDATHVKKEMIKQSELKTSVGIKLERNILVNDAINKQLKKIHMTVFRRTLRNFALRIGLYDLLYKIFAK